MNIVEPEFLNETLNTQISLQRNPEIDETFREVFEFYKYTERTNRTYTPKQKTSKQLAKIVHYLNQIILPENVKTQISKRSKRSFTVRHGPLQK